MNEWRKYKRTNRRKPKPPQITFSVQRGSYVFRSNTGCFKALGLDPSVGTRVDIYFLSGMAAIVPSPNGELVWKTGCSGAAAFRNEGWDVSHNAKYPCTVGDLYGEPALIIRQADKL